MVQPRLVYLVDDAADYRFLTQQVFTRFLPEHQLVLFADGADLVDSFTDTPEALPWVIALDVDMPRLNGFQTLVQLKQHPLWRSVPVVMITNRDDQAYQQEAYRLGAASFVLKPMDLMAIKSLMTRLCEYEGDFRQLTNR